MLLIKNFLAAGVIPAYTIVKPGGTDFQIVAAAAGADKVTGVTTDVDAASGERADVIQLGEAKVVAGAAFAAGDLLMSDASGRAITAAAAAGVNVRTVGYARQSANALGDIVEINVQPGVFQG
jgi:hypothetical protein